MLCKSCFDFLIFLCNSLTILMLKYYVPQNYCIGGKTIKNVKINRFNHFDAGLIQNRKLEVPFYN